MTLCSAASETEVTAYERELGEYLGVEHVVAVSSGTAALQTALNALSVGPGDEVLVAALSVVMSAAPILHLGARPVCVDCTPAGTDFDYDDLARKLSGRTAAVLPVYLWGRAGDTARLRRFADDHGLAVVADACQALGTTVNGAQAGVDATIACFSTHELKLLPTGEGGFLATGDNGLAERARAYRSHWLTPPRGQRPLSRLGHNFRLAEPLAAIGRRELARFDTLIAQRIGQTALLLDLLTEVPQLRPAGMPDRQRWNHYAPLLHLRLDRTRQFSEHLAKRGVPNSTGSFHLIPLDQRPPFSGDTLPTCASAAEFLDGILAVVLTRVDDEAQIRHYAKTITREATRWANG
ncbi:MAG: DegT/DnrJ/EryC1/StrS family aminotransferase [Pseudonocardiaceae bacterium]